MSGLLHTAARKRFSSDPSESVRVAFFVTSVVILSSVVFGLMIAVRAHQPPHHRARRAASRTPTIPDLIIVGSGHDEDLVRASRLVYVVQRMEGERHDAA